MLSSPIHRIVLATRNQGKVREIEEIFRDVGVKLASLASLSIDGEIIEDGDTFLENALIKARTTHRWTGFPAIADDSGLEVDALDGSPGVHSARFTGSECDDASNNAELLQLLLGVPSAKRTARFRCVVALASDNDEHWVEGSCEGVILENYRGLNGFGYDPLFYVPEKSKTFAEMSTEEKNAISHRGRAFRKMASYILSLNQLVAESTRGVAQPG